MARDRRRAPGASARVATLLALGVALAGCGSDAAQDTPGPTPTSSGEPSSGSPSPSPLSGSLEGKAWSSTSVTGRDLVGNTVVLLSFADGVMTASAGCNTLSGAYELEEALLAWSDAPATTMIACTPPLVRQDRWLEGMLTTGAEAIVTGDTLTLEADGVVLELTGGQTNRPEGALGRTWRLIGTLEDGVTRRLPRGISRPSLSVRADGLARLNTGCNTGRTTVRVEGDQLAFGPATLTRQACQGAAAAAVEGDLLAVVDGQTTDQVEVRDRLLLMSVGDRGLVFELDRGTVGG